MNDAYPHWKSGLALAVLAAFTWGTLPMALKIALVEVEPITLAFLRFLLAFLLSWTWLTARGQGYRVYREAMDLSNKHRAYLLLAGVCLTGNYVTFVWGVHYATPANSQLFIQLSPLLFGMAGVFMFKEQMSGGRWLGVLLLISGLGLFYKDQVELLDSTLANYKEGCLWLLVAAVCWAGYATFQKLLNAHLRPAHIMTWVYLLATLLLAPISQPQVLPGLSLLPLAAVIYGGLNTLIAYGAFSEAIYRWEASRVSAVLPLTPVFTMLLMPLGAWYFPQYLRPEKIAGAGWLGVALVLSGSTLSALSRTRSAPSSKRVLKTSSNSKD